MFIEELCSARSYRSLQSREFLWGAHISSTCTDQSYDSANESGSKGLHQFKQHSASAGRQHAPLFAAGMMSACSSPTSKAL